MTVQNKDDIKSWRLEVLLIPFIPPGSYRNVRFSLRRDLRVARSFLKMLRRSPQHVFSEGGVNVALLTGAPWL